MNNRIYSMISLAQKAGKLISGENTCERELKSGRSKLIIIAEDSSANTKKQFRDACSYRKVPLIEYGSKELLGQYTGKDYRAVLSITDNNFARTIIDLYNCHAGVENHESHEQSKVNGGEAFVKTKSI